MARESPWATTTTTAIPTYSSPACFHYDLLRNRGDGTFEDATERAGLAGPRENPTSSAFADLDNDGDLDLYVCHYARWDPDNPPVCKNERGERFYCDPAKFERAIDHVFRNDRGRFVDVTETAGFTDADGHGLGVVAADLDDDNRIDLFVANDGTANFLFRNQGSFQFTDDGLTAGVAGMPRVDTRRAWAWRRPTSMATAGPICS